MILVQIHKGTVVVVVVVVSRGADGSLSDQLRPLLLEVLFVRLHEVPARGHRVLAVAPSAQNPE